MSDTQGQNPESTPNEGTGVSPESGASAEQNHVPEAAVPGVDADAQPTEVILPVNDAETVPQHPVAPGAQPGQPVPPYGSQAQAQAAQPAPPVQPAAAPAPVPSSAQAAPGVASPGAAAPYVYGTPAYGQPAHAARQAPQYPGGAYPAQPQHPAAAYAGAPYGGTPLEVSGASQPGASFGAAAQAQPGAVATAPKPTGTAGKVVGLLVAAALVGGGAGFGGAALWGAVGGDNRTEPAAGPSAAIINNPETATLTTEIAAKVLPSVVTLDVAGQSQAGSGSGVVLSSDGYVLTNTHVVTLDGAESNPTIRATASDGRIFTAKVVGLDPMYDLAVVKLVDAAGLTPIEFANSSKLNVGDRAIAVGAPLGLSNTVTDGIVSALNRSIEIASAAAPDNSATQQDRRESPAPNESQTPGDGGSQGESPWFFDIPGQNAPRSGSETISIAVIQTDAAINPGNSGGALVNGKGQLIGINVAIATASGTGANQAGSIGVGFAIPSNVAERISAELIESGVATHGLLGATVQAASVESNATVAGVIIRELTPGGAAEKAGIEPGDVVTEFNGSPISSAVDLTAQVRAAAAGTTAQVTYLRGGSEHTVEVTLGSL